jgi:acyl dehydratase
MLKVGEKYTHTFSFSQEDVIAFAKVTGDNNPVHLDEDYAAATMFKKPIMHGMLGASIFSKVFGTLFPGEGTIYLNQNIQFTRPMYAGDQYEAQFEIVEIDSEKHRAKITTSIVNIEGKTVILGDATLMHTTQF